GPPAPLHPLHVLRTRTMRIIAEEAAAEYPCAGRPEPGMPVLPVPQPERTAIPLIIEVAGNQIDPAALEGGVTVDQLLGEELVIRIQQGNDPPPAAVQRRILRSADPARGAQGDDLQALGEAAAEV